MKLLVIGATGIIGSRIVDEALSRGKQVIAASRNPKPDDRAGVETVAVDIADAARLRQLAGQADVVVSAVSPRNTGNPEKEASDYADTLITALDGSRVILVGGAGTLDLPDGTPVANVVPEQYAAEARGMRAAFDKISASDLDCTTLAPAGLIEPGERTGAFRLGGRTLLTDEEGNSRISAEDYAVALLDEVETPSHRGEIFTAAY